MKRPTEGGTMMRDLQMLRDFQMPGRSAALGTNGMAATSHPLATLAAIDVLRSGGNAVDAAIAAVAVLCVVEPAMTGIGGDCFALYAPASGGVIALNGSGRAPMAASPEQFAELGLREIPARSPHSVTVPGAIAAWDLLARTHGTRSLGELLQPAIHHAEEGFAVMARVSFDWLRNADTLASNPAAKAFYLPGGKPPTVRRVMRFPALARTFRAIAERGAASFYEGELAAAMVETLRALGGVHTIEDFAAAKAEFVDPIRTNYRDAQVYQCPPNGQGVITLLMLNILEGYDFGRMAPMSAERLHLIAEAGKLAFRDRDAVLADPLLRDVPVSKLLDKGYAAKLREQIDPDQALKDLPPPLLDAHPDTTYLTVVDRDLNAVSFINSLYDAFGSGIACETTGVLFHCRGRAFKLDPTHPNCIAPGKRPMHTIIPGMAFRGGEAWLSYGVMGGNFQPVGHTLVLTGLIDHELNPQTAIDAPRIMCFPTDLEVERGVPASARAGLQLRGHALVEPESPLGGGQAILIDRRRGMLVGGSDPRKDGIALGI
jgi:gamma-glutamyltranspeptidase / glutathione hydrolase